MEKKLSLVKKMKPRPLGASAYLHHLKGGSLPPSLAIQAKCFECMGFYLDGIKDCQTVKCPLYLYMPYKKEITHDTKRHNDLSTTKMSSKK